MEQDSPRQLVCSVVGGVRRERRRIVVVKGQIATRTGRRVVGDDVHGVCVLVGCVSGFLGN